MYHRNGLVYPEKIGSIQRSLGLGNVQEGWQLLFR